MSQAVDDPRDLPRPASPRERRRARRIALGVLAVLLSAVVAGLGWKIWGLGPILPQQALFAQRGADGRFPEDPTDRPDQARLAATKANKSTSATAITTAGGSARVAARTAVIRLDTPDLLAQRVAHELFKEMQKSSRFESLRYLPPGERLPERERLPDLFLSVGVDSLEESGIAPFKSLKARVTIRMGDQPRRSNHSYSDHLSPPVVSQEWTARIDYDATEIGIETASARYEAVGRDLAGDAAKSIAKQLDETAKKHGEWRAAPPEFYPEFVPGPELPIVAELKAERLVSGTTLMTKNLTVWRATLPKSEPDVAKRIARSLEAAGYPDALKSIDGDERHLRVQSKDGARVVQAFRPVDYEVEREKAKTEQEWYVVYTHRTTEDEVTAALRKMLERGPSEDELLGFANWWYREAELIGEYFKKHPPRSTPAILHLAKRKLDAKEPDEAKRLLLRGDALRRITQFNAGPSDEEKKLGEKVGLPEFPKVPDLAALEPGDAIDVRKDLPATRTVRVNEDAILLAGQEGDEARFVIVTLVPWNDDATRFAFRVRRVEIGPGRSSSSDTTSGDALQAETRLDSFGENEKPLTVKAKRSPDAEAFELAFE